MDYAKMHSQPVPQSEPIPGRESDMAKNAAGGFTFTLDKWDRLQRFLILGTEGGTYYASEQKITLENTRNAQACLAEDGPLTVSHAVNVIVTRRAPKPDAALFVLALATVHGDVKGKEAAYSGVASACRTATHLFQWAEQHSTLGGGFASGFQRAVKGWYLRRSAKELAYQVTKYRSRHGFTHLDMMRLWHPTKAEVGDRDMVFSWLKSGKAPEGEPTIAAFAALQDCKDPVAAAVLVREHQAPREWVPVELLKHAEVWAALAEHMPPTALFRNLGALGSRGLLKELSATEASVLSRIVDAAKKVHPIQPLLALGVYGAGRGEKGSLTWTVNTRIQQALGKAFYDALDRAEPTGKRFMVAIDISGSMGSPVPGYPALSCRVAASSLGVFLTKKEPNSFLVGFDTQLVRLPYTTVEELVRVHWAGGGTDAALPMMAAIQENLEIDVFVCITDNQTWAGRMHPSDALEAYRKKSGIDAKLVVLAMAATSGSIGDPTSPHHLNMIGLDANFPTVLSEFVGGKKNPNDAEQPEEGG